MDSVNETKFQICCQGRKNERGKWHKERNVNFNKFGKYIFAGEDLKKK